MTLAASQKGMMTPPGLGFLFFNDRAAQARDALPLVSPFWDWRPRADPQAFYQYHCGTAPTHHLYGLRAALDLIHGEGIEAVWARHETLARAIWAAVEAWGQGGPLTINAAPGIRSHAVTALRLGGDRADCLRDWCAAEGGVTLGVGLGMADPGSPDAGGYFRIGHMGHVNAHMVLGALAAIQSGLQATGTPFGPGALDAAAAICAGG